MSSRTPPASSASWRRNMTFVGSPIQFVPKPCNAIWTTNDVPRLYSSSFRKRVWRFPHRRSHRRSSVTTRLGPKANPTVGSSKYLASVLKAPGSRQSSPCTNWIYSPRASSIHLLWFSAAPRRDWLRTTRSPSRSIAVARATQSSDESSSTIRISKSVSCSKTLRRQRSMVGLLLYVGTHTEISGVLGESSALKFTGRTADPSFDNDATGYLET